MIYWITGRNGSGKTTLAHKIAKQINGVVLDGDEIRNIYPTGFSFQERRGHQKRIMKLARIFDKQGFNVVIACVSPEKSFRRLMIKCLKAIEIQMPFGELWEGTEYEE